MYRTSAPTSKTLWISLTAFAAGATVWFTMPEYAVYAVSSMILGYVALMCGILFRGV